MKKRKTTVVDFHYDIIKEILIRVARSSDGAKDIANAICVCKAFRQFVEDEDVLRVVTFDNLFVSGRWELFQLIEGLINRCARAGHTEAQLILAKIILVSTSQLLTAKEHTTRQEAPSPNNSSMAQTQASSFMQNFLSDRTHPHMCSTHFYLVRLFLSHAGLHEIEKMRQFILDYVEYFLECMDHYQNNFFLSLSELCLSSLGQESQCCGLKLAEFTRRLCNCALKCDKFFWMEEERLKACAEEGKEEDDGRSSSSSSSSVTSTLVQRLEVSLERFMSIAVVYEDGIRKTMHFERDTHVSNVGSSLLLEIAEATASAQDHVLEFRVRASQLEDLRADFISEFDSLMSNL